MYQFNVNIQAAPATDDGHRQPYTILRETADLPENIRQHRERVMPVAARLVTEARGILRHAASMMRNTEDGRSVGDKAAEEVADYLDRLCCVENGGVLNLEDVLLAIEVLEEECALPTKEDN